MYVINPFIVNIITKIPTVLFLILAIVLLLIHIVDIIISFNIIWKFKNISQNIYRDSTERVTEFVRNEIIKNNKMLYKRLIKAFPKLEVLRNFKIKKDKELENKKLS